MPSMPATGQERWVYDPKVDRAVGAKACCDVVNRGVAVYDGKVFVGVIDGRLVALDAEDRIGGLGDGHGRSVAALHHHRRAARRQRPRLHRQRRRGVRRARLRLRLRGQHRQAAMALLHRPRRSVEGTGQRRLRSRHGQSRRDVERAVVDARRRRHRLGRDRLRPGLQSADRRRRQRLAVEPAAPIARRRRQPGSSRRSSRSTPPPAPTSGTTRPRRARPGTTPPRSPSSLPSSRSTASPGRSRCRRRRTASSTSWIARTAS